MTHKRNLVRDNGGAAAVEFALALPPLLLMIFGIFQLALAFYANAGMQHALGEGARFATLYIPPATPTSQVYPTAADVKARVVSNLFGATDGTFYVFDPDTTTPGSYLLKVRHTRSLDFIFFKGPTVIMDRQKRVYLAGT